ncbi:MAG: SRPBCC family protein [Armatimonadota bacterium]
MSERSVTHDTFVIERVYRQSPARVFAAWSSLEAKLRWSSCHEGGRHEMDFRIGGRETHRAGPAGGPVYFVDARFHDIVPDERIVFSYDMYADETHLSVSLVSVEFRAEGEGTRLVVVEHGAYLDGHDVPAHREQGTGQALEHLAEELDRQTAS